MGRLDRILECASAANSDLIGAEDKDLLRVGQFGSARIVTIREFIKEPTRLEPKFAPGADSPVGQGTALTPSPPAGTA